MKSTVTGNLYMPSWTRPYLAHPRFTAILNMQKVLKLQSIYIPDLTQTTIKARHAFPFLRNQ